jgi:hypothetical protein
MFGPMESEWHRWMTVGGTGHADPAALIPRVLAERAVHPAYQPIVDLQTRVLVGSRRWRAVRPDRRWSCLARRSTPRGARGCCPCWICSTPPGAMEVARDDPDGVPQLVFITQNRPSSTMPSPQTCKPPSGRPGRTGSSLSSPNAPWVTNRQRC